MDDKTAQEISLALSKGSVNFFLGAGASAPREDENWYANQNYPTVNQLKDHLRSHCDIANDIFLADFGGKIGTLSEVASYCLYQDRLTYRAALTLAFYDRNVGLRSPINDLIAQCIIVARSKPLLPSLKYRYPIILTTNLDDAVEKSLEHFGIPYLTLVSATTKENPKRGLREAGKYGFSDAEFEGSASHLECCVHLVKLHGEVKNEETLNEAVMTEGDYINNLGQFNLKEIFHGNSGLDSGVQNSNWLFLGYSLSDWNIRVLLKLYFLHNSGLKRWAVSSGFSNYQALFLREEFSIKAVNSDLNDFCESILSAPAIADSNNRPTSSAQTGASQ